MLVQGFKAKKNQVKLWFFDIFNFLFNENPMNVKKEIRVQTTYLNIVEPQSGWWLSDIFLASLLVCAKRLDLVH